MTGALVWNFRAELRADTVKAPWVGVFVLAGLWLLYLAGKSWLQWRRFGTLPLTLDPYRVTVGGDLGGTIEIPGLRATYDTPFEVTLSCVRVTIRRSGKSRKRNERVEWRERGTVTGAPGVRGTRLQLRFAVPGHLPATTPPSRDYHKWVCTCTPRLPGSIWIRRSRCRWSRPPWSCNDRLAVSSTRAPRSARRWRPGTARQRRAPAWRSATALRGCDFSIRAPANAAWASGSILGLVFGGVPLFFVSQIQSATAGDAFRFGRDHELRGRDVRPVRAPAHRIYLIRNSLEVIVSTHSVDTVRRLYGVPVHRRHALRESITGLQSKIFGPSGQGTKAKVSYTIKAVLSDGRTLAVGDGIRGVTEAKRVLARLREHLGLPARKQSCVRLPRQGGQRSAPTDRAR